MRKKARFPVRLRRARHRGRKFAFEGVKRAFRAVSILSRVVRGTGTPACTEADMLDLTRLSVQPPRERGTCRAFALAVAMHAVLVAFLFSGAHWPKSAPAGTTAAETDRSTSAPSSLPVPSATDEFVRSTAREEDAHINIASQPGTHRYRPAVRRVQPPKPPRQASLVRTLVARAGERTAQQADTSADQQHEERLAVLQALAADVSSRRDLEHDSATAASPGYADRVRRRVRPNVVAPMNIDGNPPAIIAVRCAPDGSL
jgi:colicin import membrane protein